MNGWEALMVGLVGVGAGYVVYRVGYNRGQQAAQLPQLPLQQAQRVVASAQVATLEGLYGRRR